MKTANELSPSVARPKALLLAASLLAISFSFCARASEVHLLTGGYSFTAESNGRSGTKTNLGAYYACFETPLLTGLEVSIGYSILISGIVTGDMAFGLDLGVNWYPLTHSEPRVFRDSGHVAEVNELWRPYVGVSFDQRQFQVVQSGYAGGGLVAGIERALVSGYSLKSFVRYLIFAGPNGTTATELLFAFGVGMSF